jgi:hypothetical protein
MNRSSRPQNDARDAKSSRKGSEHTPGPWEWDSGVIPPDGPGRYADIYVDGGDTIIASFNNCIPEGVANARLIAAAPELLEAAHELDALLCEVAPEYAESPVAAAARAAIAKALYGTSPPSAELGATGNDRGRDEPIPTLPLSDTREEP